MALTQSLHQSPRSAEELVSSYHGAAARVYTREIIDIIRRCSDLIELFAEVTEVKRSGTHYMAVCPFHRDHDPSCCLYVGDEPHYHCFACGAHGDAITFVMQQHQLSFHDALVWLSRRFGIDLPEVCAKPTEGRIALELFAQAHAEMMRGIHDPDAQDAVRVMANRGVDTALIEWFRIGWVGLRVAKMMSKWNSEQQRIAVDYGLAKKTGRGIEPFGWRRIALPLRNRQQRVVGFSYRTLSAGNADHKYINTRTTKVFEKGNCIFTAVPPPSVRHRPTVSETPPLALVEGPFDAMACALCGIEGWALGGTHIARSLSWRLSQAQRPVMLVLDGDAAGLKAVSAAVEALLSCGVSPSIVMLPDGKDPGDYMRTPDALRDMLITRQSAWWDAVLEIPEVKHGIKAQPLEIAYKFRRLISALPDPAHRDHIAQIIERRLQVPAGACSSASGCWSSVKATHRQRRGSTTHHDGPMTTLEVLSRLLILFPQQTPPDIVAHGIGDLFFDRLCRLIHQHQWYDRHQLPALITQKYADLNVPEPERQWVDRIVKSALQDTVLSQASSSEAAACWQSSWRRFQLKKTKAQLKAALIEQIIGGSPADAACLHVS